LLKGSFKYAEEASEWLMRATSLAASAVGLDGHMKMIDGAAAKGLEAMERKRKEAKLDIFVSKLN